MFIRMVVQNLSMPSFSQTDRIAKYNRDFQYIVGAYGVRPLLLHFYSQCNKRDRMRKVGEIVFCWVHRLSVLR
jgi:hypothetical protein